MVRSSLLPSSLLVIKPKKYIDDFVMFEDTYARVQPSINNGSLTISCFVTRETFTPDAATTKDEQDKIPHDMETVIGRPDLKQLVFDFCSGSGTVGMTSKSAAISAIFSGHNNVRCRDDHCSLRPYCVHDGREQCSCYRTVGHRSWTQQMRGIVSAY